MAYPESGVGTGREIDLAPRYGKSIGSFGSDSFEAADRDFLTTEAFGPKQILIGRPQPGERADLGQRIGNQLLPGTCNGPAWLLVCTPDEFSALRLAECTES